VGSKWNESLKERNGDRLNGTPRAVCELSEGESRKWTRIGQPATSAVCTRVWRMFLLAVGLGRKTCGWLNGACGVEMCGVKPTASVGC